MRLGSNVLEIMKAPALSCMDSTKTSLCRIISKSCDTKSLELHVCNTKRYMIEDI